MAAMGRLARAFACASLLAGVAASGVAGRAQQTGVLLITVTLGEGGARVPRHVLLVSDNPASRIPWRAVTGSDGRARVTLPPGNYTVESEEPLAFQGRAYEWRQTLDVAAGGETTLALTIANAEVVSPPAPASDADGPPTLDPWDLLVRWEASVVGLWTPTTYATGTIVDTGGLLATSHHAVGTAETVEVQVTPALKIAARVVATDPARDLAILWLDAAALATRAPVPLACDVPRSPSARRETIAALGVSVRGQAYTTTGTAVRLPTGAVMADFDFAVDSTGGPILAGDGTFVGLAVSAAPTDGATEETSRVAPVEDVCRLVDAARATARTATPPPPTPLPQEPPAAVPEDALRAALKARAGSLTPYAASSASFDIALITPVVAYAGLQQSMDFGNWSAYVAERPAVLLVRVTPKQVESFWVKVARGAAMTQGVALPPIKRFKPGFAGMRVRCGEEAVTPIHPFVIERRTSETDAVREGLYVFAPDALGPHCGTVTLELTAEKAPDRRETATIDKRLLEQIWADLAPLRQADSGGPPVRN